MTKSERFVLWIAGKLHVSFIFMQAHDDVLKIRESEYQSRLDTLKRYGTELEAELDESHGNKDELAVIIETQFNNARMMTHSAMPNRETEAWWGGVTFACAGIYEKLGKEVPPDIAGMMAKFSRIFVG